MTIKIKLSTGKEIELTKEEYEELIGRTVIAYPQYQIYPQPVPYIPQYPISPWTTQPVIYNSNT
jgi:hypothetical protein